MPTMGGTTAFGKYRAELAEVTSLAPEVELSLAEAYRAGDREAGHKLVRACLPFVVGVALEYRRWGAPLEDIVQEGNIGLLKAAQRFDPSRGCRLVTYAGYWVRAEIRDFLVRSYRIVRIGTSKNERRALRAYRLHRHQTPEALASVSGLSEDRAAQLLPLLMARDVGIDTAPDASVPLAERLVADGPSPEETVANDQLSARYSEALQVALGELPARERAIIEWRWMAEEPQTLERLGNEFGISKERVRQLEERAKRRMRDRLQALVRDAA